MGFEDFTDNINCSIPFVPQRLQNTFCMLTVANHLDQQWVGLITNLQATTAIAQGSCDVDGNHYLEHIIRNDKTKSSMC